MVLGCFWISLAGAQGPVRIGLNYPETGVFSTEGLDQRRAADMAVDQINAQGGILGREVELVVRDTQCQEEVAVSNVRELIDREEVVMVTGGASSKVAMAVGRVCYEKRVPFMATVTLADATTCEGAHRTSFRACYNGTMASRALAGYLNEHMAGKRFFYVVSDYTTGWAFETALRELTHTQDNSHHKRMLVPLAADEQWFRRVARYCEAMEPEVVVMIVFGKDADMALKQATLVGLKGSSQIVVPSLTLGTAESLGPKVMEGIVGTMDWNWRVPYVYDFEGGQRFVEEFVSLYHRYPDFGAAAQYTNLMQYKEAVERAGSLECSAVVGALEGHRFTLLKDEQQWRDFDHQCLQTVFLIQCKSKCEVLRDPLKLDYFDVLASFPAEQVARSRELWKALREAASLSPNLESLEFTP